MSEFKREVRYTVIKHSQLTESQMQYLKGCIFGEGIPTVEAVVVESDWPEYQPVWNMIEDRVTSAPVEGGKAEYDAMAEAMTTNQTIDGVPLLPCPFCGGEPYGTHDHYVHDDMSPMPCVECRSCSAHLKAEDWNRRTHPVAQPPSIFTSRFLTDVMTASGLVAHGKRDKKFAERLADECSLVRSALYAEQPAPVVVVLPERKTLDGLRATACNLKGEVWNACLDEVTRLNTKSR